LELSGRIFVEGEFHHVLGRNGHQSLHIVGDAFLELFLGVGTDLKSNRILDAVPFRLQTRLFAVESLLGFVNTGGAWVGVDLSDPLVDPGGKFSK